MDYENLIFKLRDKLAEIDIDQYNDKQAYRDLEDAYDTITMIADTLEVDLTDYTTFPTAYIERCTIRLGTYNAYRNYTRLAEKQIGTLPLGSGTIISYDVSDVKSCLSLLFGIAFDDDLLPVVLTASITPVVAGSRGSSILDE
jgi:hypothetical protein